MPKPLDKNAVKKTAEFLMISNGATTTLDVKNQLRKDDYFALQKDVSTHMRTLANEQSWGHNDKGGFRSYYFRNDSNIKLHEYYENSQGQYWEIFVQAKKLTESSGRIGSAGSFYSNDQDTNRKAIFEAYKLIDQKKNQGYAIAIDKRLSMDIRKEYADYFSKTPVQCTIGYFGTNREVKSEGIFYQNNQTHSGYLLENYGAGYNLNWTLPNKVTELKDMLDNEEFILNNLPDSAELLGEKRLSVKAYDQSQSPLNQYDKFEAYRPDGETLKFSVDNRNIFQIKIKFDNGETLSLSKFKLDYNKEFIPLARKILFND